MEDVHAGMVLPGVVTNLTRFGAFVDIGVKQDGLVHVSEMAHRYISDPAEVVKLGDKVTVKVTEVDISRRRIALSMKQAVEVPPATQRSKQPARPPQPRKADDLTSLNVNDALAVLKKKFGK